MEIQTLDFVLHCKKFIFWTNSTAGQKLIEYSDLKTLHVPMLMNLILYMKFWPNTASCGRTKTKWSPKSIGIILWGPWILTPFHPNPSQYQDCSPSVRIVRIVATILRRSSSFLKRPIIIFIRAITYSFWVCVFRRKKNNCDFHGNLEM